MNDAEVNNEVEYTETEFAKFQDLVRDTKKAIV